MASIINASTTGGGGLIQSADASGVLQLQSGGTTVATVSNAGVAVIGNLTATGNLAGNGPAFSAYSNAGQAISLNVWTKLAFQVKEFDTNSNFDNVTNYRFTPTVAGYYQVNSLFGITATATNLQIAIYKNGSIFKYGANPSSGGSTNIAALIYCNGSTDYLEIYANLNTNAQNTTSGQPYQYFQAAMVRGA